MGEEAGKERFFPLTPRNPSLLALVLQEAWGASAFRDLLRNSSRSGHSG